MVIDSAECHSPKLVVENETHAGTFHTFSQNNPSLEKRGGKKVLFTQNNQIFGCKSWRDLGAWSNWRWRKLLCKALAFLPSNFAIVQDYCISVERQGWAQIQKVVLNGPGH